MQKDNDFSTQNNCTSENDDEIIILDFNESNLIEKNSHSNISFKKDSFKISERSVVSNDSLQNEKDDNGKPKLNILFLFFWVT